MKRVDGGRRWQGYSGERRQERAAWDQFLSASSVSAPPLNYGDVWSGPSVIVTLTIEISQEGTRAVITASSLH